MWPGGSPDINPEENMGGIIKDKVEELIGNEDQQIRHNYDMLKTNLKNTLNHLENGTSFYRFAVFNGEKI